VILVDRLRSPAAGQLATTPSRVILPAPFLYPVLQAQISRPLAVTATTEQVRIYSLRNAIIGSMRDARRAGTKEARTATVTRMRDATVTVGR
jgi:hypothetical protein